MTGLDLGVMEVRDTILSATANLKPNITYVEKAQYTVAARDNGVQGTVIVSAIFRADGTITDLTILRGLPLGLNEEAIKAARKIKFKPAIKDGIPVSVKMSMEFSFQLLRRL